MVVRVERVRRVDCRVAVVVEERRATRVVVRRVGGTREDTVEVDFVVVAVIMLVSLSLSSSESSGGREAIVVFRRRFGDEWTGLETGTAEAERRVPAAADRLARAISHVPADAGSRFVPPFYGFWRIGTTRFLAITLVAGLFTN